MSDVQRLLIQLADSVASEEGGPTLFVVVGGAKVSGRLIGRKGYIERMRAVSATLPQAEQATFEAVFTQLETAPDALDTLYLDHARVNDQPLGAWCVCIAAVDAAAILVG